MILCILYRSHFGSRSLSLVGNHKSTSDNTLIGRTMDDSQYTSSLARSLFHKPCRRMEAGECTVLFCTFGHDKKKDFNPYGQKYCNHGTKCKYTNCTKDHCDSIYHMACLSVFNEKEGDDGDYQTTCYLCAKEYPCLYAYKWDMLYFAYEGMLRFLMIVHESGNTAYNCPKGDKCRNVNCFDHHEDEDGHKGESQIYWEEKHRDAFREHQEGIKKKTKAIVPAIVGPRPTGKHTGISFPKKTSESSGSSSTTASSSQKLSYASAALFKSSDLVDEDGFMEVSNKKGKTVFPREPSIDPIATADPEQKAAEDASPKNEIASEDNASIKEKESVRDDKSCKSDGSRKTGSSYQNSRNDAEQYYTKMINTPIISLYRSKLSDLKDEEISVFKKMLREHIGELDSEKTSLEVKYDNLKEQHSDMLHEINRLEKVMFSMKNEIDDVESQIKLNDDKWTMLKDAVEKRR